MDDLELIRQRNNLFCLFADLEYALSEELETGTYPSAHLTDTVEMWANRLHGDGVLTNDDLQSSLDMVAQSRKMLANDDGSECQCPEGWDTSSGYHDGDVCSK